MTERSMKEITIEKGEYWWGGAIHDGCIMPIGANGRKIIFPPGI